MNKRCRCGNEFIPKGMVAGFATIASGERICYDCANAGQVQEMRDLPRISAYVSNSGNLITWTGFVLAAGEETAPCKLTRESCMHSPSGFRSRWFRDATGQRWYGRGSCGVLIHVRKVNG